MKLWRSTRGVLLLASIDGGLSAQPEKKLSDAVDRLWAAGNYSWKEALKNPSRGAKRALVASSPIREKRTSVASRPPRHSALGRFSGKEIVLLLKSGWRHADDLTDADRLELGGYRPEAAIAKRLLPSFSSIPAVPHELLRVLLGSIGNIRQEGAAIVCDLGAPFDDRSTLEGYLRNGSFPRGPLPPRLNSSQSRGKTELVVWLDGGSITEFSVEFNTTRTLIRGPDPGSQQAVVNSVFVKLAKIGTTFVEIDPEAKALFLSATK